MSQKPIDSKEKEVINEKFKNHLYDYLYRVNANIQNLDNLRGGFKAHPILEYDDLSRIIRNYFIDFPGEDIFPNGVEFRNKIDHLLNFDSYHPNDFKYFVNLILELKDMAEKNLGKDTKIKERKHPPLIREELITKAQALMEGSRQQELKENHEKIVNEEARLLKDIESRIKEKVWPFEDKALSERINQFIINARQKRGEYVPGQEEFAEKLMSIRNPSVTKDFPEMQRQVAGLRSIFEEYNFNLLKEKEKDPFLEEVYGKANTLTNNPNLIYMSKVNHNPIEIEFGVQVEKMALAVSDTWARLQLHKWFGTVSNSDARIASKVFVEPYIKTMRKTLTYLTNEKYLSTHPEVSVDNCKQLDGILDEIETAFKAIYKDKDVIKDLGRVPAADKKRLDEAMNKFFNFKLYSLQRHNLLDQAIEQQSKIADVFAQQVDKMKNIVDKYKFKPRYSQEAFEQFCFELRDVAHPMLQVLQNDTRLIANTVNPEQDRKLWDKLKRYLERIIDVNWRSPYPLGVKSTKSIEHDFEKLQHIVGRLTEFPMKKLENLRVSLPQGAAHKAKETKTIETKAEQQDATLLLHKKHAPPQKTSTLFKDVQDLKEFENVLKTAVASMVEGLTNQKNPIVDNNHSPRFEALDQIYYTAQAIRNGIEGAVSDPKLRVSKGNCDIIVKYLSEIQTVYNKLCYFPKDAKVLLEQLSTNVNGLSGYVNTHQKLSETPLEKPAFKAKDNKPGKV